MSYIATTDVIRPEMEAKTLATATIDFLLKSTIINKITIIIEPGMI